MKKNLFFTETFLQECELQRQNLQAQISSREAFGVIRDLTGDEIKQAKMFYNRVLYLLYRGGKISEEDYIKDSYLMYKD